MASAEGKEALEEVQVYIAELMNRLANVEAESLRRGKMLLQYRDSISNINDCIEDDGDRVFLGSTNDAEKLREIAAKLEGFHWDQILAERGKRDVFVELHNANAYIRLLEENGDLARLGRANIARDALWDPEGKLDDSFHSNELAGETGEVCNVIKKLERKRLGLRGSRDTVEHLGQELADNVICASILATRHGINLWDEIVSKFNTTSEVQGFECFLLKHTKEAI